MSPVLGNQKNLASTSGRNSHSQSGFFCGPSACKSLGSFVHKYHISLVSQSYDSLKEDKFENYSHENIIILQKQVVFANAPTIAIFQNL